jgi:hypothetical protein
MFTVMFVMLAFNQLKLVALQVKQTPHLVRAQRGRHRYQRQGAIIRNRTHCFHTSPFSEVEVTKSID